MASLSLVCAAGLAGAQTAQVDSFVQSTLSAKPAGRVGVILKTATPLSKADEAKLGSLGAYVYRRLPIIGSAAVNVPAKNLAKVLSLSFVQRASQDAMVQKTDAFTVGASGADTAWRQYNAYGDGVGVAVLDSGIKQDLDFSDSWLINSRIVANVNFAAGTNTTTDLCGHGTHVAGIIGGNGTSSSGWLFTQTYYGVAPQSNLINVPFWTTMAAEWSVKSSPASNGC